MVAIFTGLGAGLVRGSGNVLGGAGQLGSGLLGRGGEGVSINAATGNLVVSRQDEFLIGQGPDIGISRTYNSLADAGDGDNADNWQQSTTRQVFGLTGTANTAGSTISRLGADGSVIVYSWDAGRSAYVTSAGSGAFDTLTFAGGVWTWRDGDTQATESYAAHGADSWRIVSASDVDGNSLTWSYTGDKLDTVTTADGAWTRYIWSGSHITAIETGYTDLATSSAKTLTRTLYAYDAADRLSSVTTDLSPEDNSVVDGKTYVVTYTYDGASNRIASIAQSDGSLLTIAYDAQGRVQTLTQAVATGVTRVTSLAYATGYTEVTGPDGQVTRLTYDTAGQLTAITAPPATAGATPQLTQFAYDTAGNLISVTDPRGKVTAYEHDPNGNVTKVTDANGNVAERTYDSANRLITELAYGSDKSGASAAHYTQYAYDAEGHLAYAVNAVGQVTEYLYDAAGRLTHKRVYPEYTYPITAAAIVYADIVALRDSLPDLSSLQIVEYTYDVRGNLTQEARYGTATSTGGVSSAEGVSRIFYTYDQSGQLLSRHRDGEQAETFVYDGLGRLVASSDVHGGTTTIVFADTALTTTVTNASGYVSVSAYNKAGDLISRSDSGTNTTGGTASYQYDADGRLRIVTDATGRSAYTVYDKAGRKVADVNHLGEMVAYRYDAADRVIAATRYATVLSAGQIALLADPNSTAELSALLPTANAADMWTWTVYDDGGRVIQSIASDGSVASYAYDQSDQLIRTTSAYTRLSGTERDALKLAPPTAPVTVAPHAKDVTARRFYNEAGQLVGTLDGLGYLTETVRDGTGAVVQEIAYATATLAADRANGTFTVLRGYVAGASTVDRAVRHVYDGQGLLRYTVDSAGGVTGFAYDAAGRVTTRTAYATPLAASQADFTYDAVKAAVSASGADRISYTVYDASGRVAYAVDAEGGVSAYSYDTSGRVTKTVQFVDLYPVSGLPALAAMNAWAADPAHSGDTANRVTRNWYSERGELLFTVDAGNYLRGFTYDAAGRTLSESAWPNGIVVADSATVAQVAALAVGAGSAITLSSSYDNAGRLLTRTDGEGVVTRHVYNALGQLTDTYLADNVAADTSRLHYEYDAAGRLTAEYRAYGSAEQIATFFAYDGLGNRIGTTDANGNTTHFTFDALGRIINATNALSGVTAYEYDAFGNVLKVTDPKGHASFNCYDKLDRLIATRDAAGYVTRTLYNRFGDVLSVERYSTAMTAPGETGVAVFDPQQLPTDPFAYADSLQAIADALDADADQAEADVPVKQAASTAAAQVAIDADAVVADLQAQLDALGGPQPIDFSAERAAALANASTWMSNRRTWLNNAHNSVRNLYLSVPTGAYRDELTRISSTFESESSLVSKQSNATDQANYINKFYDNLTIQRSTLSADKAGALADQMAWLQARKADLVNWITQYSSLRDVSRTEFLDDAKLQWFIIVRAIYDLTNNTYSTGWPSSTSSINAFYNNVQSNPAYLPSGIQHTTTQTADYRAVATINAFYDAKGVINDTYGAVTTAQQQAQQLQTQLDAATVDATAAHAAATAAAGAVTTAQNTAVQLRIDATQAQIAADAAYADALANAGVVLRDNYVVLDLAQLGAPSVTRFGYDKLGRVTWAVDAENYVEIYKHDAFGQQTSLARYATPIGAGLTPDVNAPAYGTPSETQFVYDNRGQVTKITDAEGYFESFAYDAYGRRVSHTDKSSSVAKVAGGTTTYTYDKRGLLLSETLPIASTTSGGTVQAASVTNTYAYDARGNRITRIEAQGLPEQRRTDYTYDKLDRLIMTQSDSVNGLTINVADKSVSAVSGRPTEKFTYDNMGNLIFRQDAAGAKTLYYYDKLNRKIAEVDPLGKLTRFAYDANGNLISQRAYDHFVESVPDVSLTYLLYDIALGRFPTSAEINNWVYRMEENYASSTDPFLAICGEILGDAGVQARLSPTNNTTFINQIFQYAFDRNATASELSTWQANMSNGWSRADMLAYFARHPDHSAAVTQTYTQYVSTQDVFQIYRLYDIALGKVPRADEIFNWAYRMQTNYASSADPLAAICGELLGDAGVQARLSTTNNTTFISQIFQLAFHRSPSASELSTWQTNMSSGGWTRAKMLAYFSEHPDHAAFVDSAALQSISGDVPVPVNGASYRETTFTYDSQNRVLTSNVLGVTTGQGSGSTWASGTGAITTSYQYDYQGNVVQLTDPNGSTLWSYYDKLGRKVAQVDAGNYLTRWTLDAEGHVMEERRYATAVAAPTSTATPPAGTNNAADRITQYTYDRNGNRLSEARLNVQYHNGSGGYSTGTATIGYLYNGLGQVTRRTEATGDQTNYTYDAGGRLTREVKAQGAADYFYDGTGNLARHVQAAVNGTQARITTYSYGAGGRLASMTDAAGYVHSYFYDVAGRMVLESYVRANSAGTTVTEAVGHRFDALGRDLGQAYYVQSGGNWNLQASADASSLEYNAHGEVTRIGINGLWQQESKYDAAGRVWASNTGDGVWKYFGYDKNGNQTLSVTSAGTSLAGLASIGAAYGQIGSATVNGTITFYNARNQAITVKEEGRQLTGSGSAELTTSRTYNAFGEVASETAPNGGVTIFTYNTLGKAITVQRPQVSITTETGTTQTVAPTDTYYHDLSGRLTGHRDANSNLTRYTLLAGSGYGGAQALVSQEIHADGGTVTRLYNAHGDATQVTDEVGLVTSMGYDNLGRLTQVNNPGGLVDYYSYNVLGQRLTHYNSLLGAANKETTDYDMQGRITSQRAFGGDTTTTSYAWSNAIATAGLGTFGGWTETTTYANGKTVVDQRDLFERTVQHTDMGGFTTTYTYDAAGRLAGTATGTGGNTSGMAYTYYNTGLLKQSTLSYTTQTYYWNGSTVVFGTQTTAVTAAYTYDSMGNRLSEVGTTSINGGAATTWKNQSATYDALGRLTTWSEAGTVNSPAATITYAYDAVGNIRRSTADYRMLNPDGTSQTSGYPSDKWFRYDNMNRLVIDRGILSGGVIKRSGALDGSSKEIIYDKAGRRVNVLSLEYTRGDWIGGTVPGMFNEQREIYIYDAAGKLQRVEVAKGAKAAEDGLFNPPATLPAAPTTGTKRAEFVYDAMGRITSQKDYEANGTTVAYDRAITYNAKNQVSSETTINKRGSDIFQSVNTYDYGSGTAYALGSVLSVTSKNYKNNNDGNAKDTSTVNTYNWRDGAMQATTTFDNDTGSSSNTLYVTTMYYDAAGRLTGASISDGKPRQVAYTLDESAQVIRRDETRPANAPSSQNGSPHEVWYRYGGRQMGYVTNNGSSDMDYEASIAERQLVGVANPGTFRNGYLDGTAYVNFSQSADPINSYYQGGNGGSYTIRSGDTLQSVAQAVWGDSSLWYKLAEANGITGNAGLIEGQVLQLPAGVIRNRHNATTANPYNPAEAIGDLSPTMAAPPKKAKGCGGLGTILMAVVAVAVTIVATAGAASVLTGASLSSSLGAVTGGTMVGLTGSAGALTSIGAVGVGMAGAAIGSVASQAFGVATGIQDKFSWKGVGLSALSGGVTAGLGSSFGGDWAAAAARGAVSSVISQGVGVVTGLQGKFDFAGVAAAGIGAGVASFAGARTAALGKFGNRLAANTAGAIANAATRSAINGESFSDNLMRALPDVIGSTVGNVLGNAAAGALARNRDPALDVISIPASQRASSNTAGEMVADGVAATAALFDDDIRSGGIEYATARQKERIVQNLAAQYRATLSAGAISQGSQTTDGLVAQPTGGADVTISLRELNDWRARAHDIYQGGYSENGIRKSYSASYYNDIVKGYDANEALIGQWNAIADAQLVDDAKLWARQVLKGGTFFAGGIGLAANIAETGVAFNNGEISASEAALSMALNARGISGTRNLVAAETTPLAYDISKWGEMGLPSDGKFVRTLTREQYRDFQAGREFSFGGAPVEGYPGGMGFIGSAEEVRGITSVSGYRDALQLSYDPKYVMEFQLRDYSGLQNVIKAPYAEFVPGGRTGAGYLEYNLPGITSRDIVNGQVRVLK